MLEAVGHPVLRLIRVRIGQVGLGNLKPGQYRHLTPEEVALFMPERSE
jgi:16S rRNA U516 pseudouridylate synthase RsuA-like enzyme